MHVLNMKRRRLRALLVGAAMLGVASASLSGALASNAPARDRIAEIAASADPISGGYS